MREDSDTRKERGRLGERGGRVKNEIISNGIFDCLGHRHLQEGDITMTLYIANVIHKYMLQYVNWLLHCRWLVLLS